MDETTETIAPRRNYFRETHSILYSYLICLPLLVFYEILILLSQPESEQIVRITVDAWFKTVFTSVGLNALSITFFTAALAGAFILIRDRKKLKHLKGAYFLGMLLEALAYAILLGIFISTLLQSLLAFDQVSSSIEELSKIQMLALSLGAGLYEELFFRVILVSLLLYLFRKLFIKNWASYSAAAILAAFIFSTVHYTGEFGDTFSLGSFLFRFLFGLALNVIYVLRGFGMAAWTHALYDILIITFR
ncbi:MAG: CPBP family glutamic-type intramembrane protease [Balneolaceae bacterium]